MIKNAKPSADPAQQKLRDSKKVWNKQVSDFADNLFRLKDMMNGKPSKFYPQKSSIKDPIPGDPVTIIGVLANDFQEIAQKGNALVQQQLEYSKTRKKKQPKQTLAPLPSQSPQSTPSVELSNQLTAKYDLDGFIAEGSNPFSRWFTRVLTPTMGSSPKARVRKYRMALLKSAVEIYDDIVELQATIVKSTPESIFISNRLLNKIFNNWEFFKTGISTFDTKADTQEKDPKNKKEPISPEDAGRTTSPPTQDMKTPPSSVAVEPLTQKVKKTTVMSVPISADEMITDYMKHSANFTDTNLKPMTVLITEYRLASPDKKSEVAPKIEAEYKKLLAYLNSKYNTTGSSLKEILETTLKKASSANFELEVQGQKLLQKWLGRLKHEFLPVDKTSAHRLDVYKTAENLRKTIDKMMDSLEKTMDTELLNKLVADGAQDLQTMKTLMDGLEKTLFGKGFDRPFMNLLDSGIMTNYGPELNEKQRERLQGMLDRRRVNELANLYQGKRK